MNLPRIIVSAPGSGSGKTLITIALIKALSLAGKKVRAFKCGPDYIDPLFHKKILGVPSRNLDLFFTDEETTRAIFAAGEHSDISVVEGVMGFYDGLSGCREEASTYHLAKTLKAPVVLVINARGMARSVLAEIAGFVSMDEEKTIKAVILNNTNKTVFESLKDEIENRFGICAAGYFPSNKELSVQSRYLGLTLPSEIENIQSMAEQAACELLKTVDVNKLVYIAEQACGLDINKEKAPWLWGTPCLGGGEKIKIAVAKDDAFCFYYEDNLKLLEYYGAELVEFSPVGDKGLPQGVCGLVMGGGYPELFAKELEKNAGLRKEILLKMNQGIPCLAECGGFMYLHESIQTEQGKSFEMVGAVKGQCHFEGRLVRFGYGSFSEKQQGLAGGREIRGHEFHYFDSSANGSDVSAVKPVSGKSWECCKTWQKGWIGFPHLYYGSNPVFAENFVAACRAFSEGK